MQDCAFLTRLAFFGIVFCLERVRPFFFMRLSMADSTPIEAQTVTGQVVNLEGGEAYVIKADTVNAHNAGVNTAYAHTLNLETSGLVWTETDALNLTQSAAGYVRAETAHLNNSAAKFVVAGEVHLNEAAAVLSIARRAEVADGARVGLLVAREVHGDVRPALDTRQTLWLGAAVAAVFALGWWLGGLGRKK